MNNQWLEDYILLALRIDKVMRGLSDKPYVDYYYGPPELRERVEAEAEMPAGELVEEAQRLIDMLSGQDFEPRRSRYLHKHVRAMETISRKMNGEKFSLEDEVESCFDIRPAWIPETQFEEALALYNEVLPGKGTLARRLFEWRRQYQLPWQKLELLPELIGQTLVEVRQRTMRLVELPVEEVVDVRANVDMDLGAACWYKGGYRSEIEISSVFNNLSSLPDLLCHEVYPGHHTECVLKEQHLYRLRGYMEQALGIILSPQAVISEGIATNACEMIFAPGEVEQWLKEYVYPRVGIELDASARVDKMKLNRARDLLEGVRCNALFMMREGRPQDEVMDYLAKYMQGPNLGLLSDPWHEGYVFTYFYGRQLMQAWLQKEDREAIFRRLLVEEMCPSDLVQSELPDTSEKATGKERIRDDEH